MAVEAVALVLREDDDLAQARVDEVRQREVDEPVVAAERDGGLGAVRRQRRKALALSAREHHPEDARRGHGANPTRGRVDTRIASTPGGDLDRPAPPARGGAPPPPRPASAAAGAA